MALRASEADSEWDFTHNARSFMHMIHFTFNPTEAVLLYGIIANQSIRASLKLHTKLESARKWHHQNILGPCMDFITVF